MISEADRAQITLPAVDEKKKVIEDVDKDRKYAIDAAIVRTMKSRKVLNHQHVRLRPDPSPRDPLRRLCTVLTKSCVAVLRRWTVIAAPRGSSNLGSRQHGAAATGTERRRCSSQKLLCRL